MEIAPGHGRWTQYLLNECDELDIVDLSPKCIDACRQRFAAHSQINYFVNDGLSLQMMRGEYDLVFSFDSLVHTEKDVIESYISQVKDLLSQDGVCFIHHSNMAKYVNNDFANIPREILDREAYRNIGRAESVDASLVAALTNDCGLQILGQELVNWGAKGPNGQPLFSDCFSLISRTESRWKKNQQQIIHNEIYMSEEALHMRNLGKLYNISSS